MPYLDNAATTRLSPTSRAAIERAWDVAFANPSSTHAAGDAARREVERARRIVAECLRCRPREVTFTSGGTEANNQALLTGAVRGAREGRRHIVASAVEHPSVLETLERLRTGQVTGERFEVTLVAPGADGVVSARDVEAAVRGDTVLVSLMYANNEVGAVQPVREVCRLCRRRGILFHTDAVQAAGHLPIDFTRDGFDLLSVSAHKFHGPKGTGALVCSHRLGGPVALLAGGGQQRGRRPGTEDAAGAAGMAAALEEAAGGMGEARARLDSLRARLVTGLARIGGAHVLGPDAPDGRLAGIACVALEGVDHDPALVLLDELGVCASAGSACSAGATESSHVLAAMGVDPGLARCALRFSLDAAENDEADVEATVAAVTEVARRLREARA